MVHLPRDAPAGHVHGLVPGDETGEGFPLPVDRPGRPVGHPAGGPVDPGDVVAGEGLPDRAPGPEVARELVEVVAAGHRRPEAAKEDDGEE